MIANHFSLLKELSIHSGRVCYKHLAPTERNRQSLTIAAKTCPLF